MVKRFFTVHFKSIIFLAGIIVLIAALDFLFAQTGYNRYILAAVNDEDSQYDTVVLGASHARCSVNPEAIDQAAGGNTINMSMLGETIKDAYYVLLETDRNNDISRVILDIDYQYLYGEQKEGYFEEPFIYNQMGWNSPVKWKYLFENMDTLDIRNGISKRNVYLCSISSMKNNIRQKTSSGYRNADIYTLDMSNTGGHYEGKGFFPLSVSGGEPANKDYIESWIGKEETGINSLPEKYLKKIINYCKENNIELICVTAPITPSCVKTLGMDVVDSDIEKLLNDEGIKYYNFNKSRIDILPRKDTDYVDYEGHMGEELANRYSLVLADVLKEHEKGSLQFQKYFYDTFDEMYRNMEAQY